MTENKDSIKTEADSAMTENQLSDSVVVESNKTDKTALTSMFVKAIHNYIDAVYQKDKTVFDTLFFINRKNGQPDDFPDIKLPQSINKTKLLLFTQQQADNHKQLYRPSAPCINLIGGVEKNKAEFIFVTFYPEYNHQYDCYINYKFNSENKDYELEKLTIEVLIFDKNKKPDHFAIYQDGKHTGDKPIK
ncbi:MAG: hypothetical protein JSU07_13945 [Bacteroidetes bacterium]|nr:hypothetical protein [Bacteroidota bacterium]